MIWTTPRYEEDLSSSLSACNLVVLSNKLNLKSITSLDKICPRNNTRITTRSMSNKVAVQHVLIEATQNFESRERMMLFTWLDYSQIYSRAFLWSVAFVFANKFLILSTWEGNMQKSGTNEHHQILPRYPTMPDDSFKFIAFSFNSATWHVCDESNFVSKSRNSPSENGELLRGYYPTKSLKQLLKSLRDHMQFLLNWKMILALNCMCNLHLSLTTSSWNC